MERGILLTVCIVVAVLNFEIGQIQSQWYPGLNGMYPRLPGAASPAIGQLGMPWMDMPMPMFGLLPQPSLETSMEHMLLQQLMMPASTQRQSQRPASQPNPSPAQGEQESNVPTQSSPKAPTTSTMPFGQMGQMPMSRLTGLLPQPSLENQLEHMLLQQLISPASTQRQSQRPTSQPNPPPAQGEQESNVPPQSKPNAQMTGPVPSTMPFRQMSQMPMSGLTGLVPQPSLENQLERMLLQQLMAPASTQRQSQRPASQPNPPPAQGEQESAVSPQGTSQAVRPGYTSPISPQLGSQLASIIRTSAALQLI